MKAILKKELIVDRPIVFLCGPYYNGSNPHDRRALLRQYFWNELGGKVLPLIIDDFLSKENLEGFHLKLSLLEEILAGISRKTLIFLDTISAASEMGLFLNHAFKNKSIILLPKKTDIINDNVGIFAQNVFKQNDHAECIYYRPSIILNTVATGYTTEFYGFINDKIPSSIEKYLKDDFELGEYEEDWDINPTPLNGEVEVKIPIRQLFYIVASIVYDQYQKVLHTPGACNDTLFNCDEILNVVNDAVTNYLADYKNTDISAKIRVKTEFEESLNNIIYHIVSFIFIFHKRSSSKGYQIIAEKKNRSVSYFSGNNPLEVFKINREDISLLRHSKEHPDIYFVRKRLSINGKKRDLIKYSEDKNGKKIRYVHQKILNNLKNVYQQHRLSFAYKTGGSIKKCAMMHIHSYDFIKYDISKFFNSIDLKVLTIQFLNEFEIDSRYFSKTREYLECFFIYGRLPLGLVLSPLLSDIYMKNFDEILEEKCKPFGWIYTRYADDLLISSDKPIDKDKEDHIEKEIIELLFNIRLRLNDKKKRHVILDHEGKYVKYIGIYIIKGSNSNTLSVGRTYINHIAKEILDYYEEHYFQSFYDSSEENLDLIYKRQMIIGRIGFLKTIEGDKGINRLKNRLKKHIVIRSNKFV